MTECILVDNPFSFLIIGIISLTIAMLMNIEGIKEWRLIMLIPAICFVQGLTKQNEEESE